MVDSQRPHEKVVDDWACFGKGFATKLVLNDHRKGVVNDSQIFNDYQASLSAFEAQW